jgi:hypothetical protein
MKKIILIAVAMMLGSAFPAFAGSNTDIQSDDTAIAKDNAAIQHDDQNLAANRAAKAAAEARGDWSTQALDSVKIEANKVTRTEKASEKGVDQGIKNNDEQ